MGKTKRKDKVNKFREFFYAIKIVSKIDKLFIFQKLFHTIISAVYSFVYAYIIRVAVAAIEQGLPMETMFRNVILISIGGFLISFFRRYLDPIFWYKGDRITSVLKQQKSIRTLEMDYELLERPETQDAVEKTNRNLGNWNGIMGLINRGFYSLQYLLSFLIAASIIVTVNWLLIIAICFLSLFKILAENKNQRREKEEFYDQTPPIWRRINYTDAISTNLTIGKDLRIFAMNEFINQERDRSVDEFKQLFKKSTRRFILYNILINFLSLLDTLFLYGFMIYEVLYHGMTIASFTFMVSSVYTLISSLHNVIHQNGYMLRNALEAKDYRLFMELEYTRDIETEEIKADTVEIEFQNVYYSYYLQDGYALENVSFKIKKGEKIALVGYNGAGKTTLVKLLSGLYHPTKGRILINGVNIENLTRESLQKLISLVFQDNIMYAMEIAENIAMKTSEKVDYQKVEDKIKLLELERKINSFPQKVKTIITRELDETGIELSGGENQKLALARAMYKNAPLFVLDEPTSALDALSEAHLYQHFNEIIQDNTAIFISHRLSSTKFCDRIIFLGEGKVKEVGTHQELMKLNGEYKKLFTMQSDYYQEVDNEEIKTN